MHEVALHLGYHLATAPSTSGSTSSTSLLTLIGILGGTIVTATATIIVASIQKDKSANAKVDGDGKKEEAERQERWQLELADREAERLERERINHAAQVQAQEHSQFVQRVLAEVTRDRDKLDLDVKEARGLYQRLREAVRAHGLDPDELMQEAL